MEQKTEQTPQERLGGRKSRTIARKLAVALCFKVGSRRVIQGWDECVRETSVGEKSTVTIEARGAYSAKGVPEAGIPPNANLLFDMELVAIV
eukprot:CAMPEP_0177710422 /NCGR_PEP_ID=MMETSP0484_2-20121128/11327_1 /TAXON_ID=354590 /ORGANISM="Rhodomonas lens, Strain RHODO" /LENGTH=91 /DNA_ID=CAMNT_0019222103 /DNA_START=165 /DNA_END=440 /DNA_ORIENTATION=+